MTHFWWVRHGPTHEKSFVGWRDVPADLTDQAQITRVSNYLPTEAVIVSSDLIRASATADVIQGERIRISDERSLREFDFGDWDGLSFDQVSKRDGDLSRKFWENPGDISAPNGESWNDVACRVNAAVDSLIAQFPGKHIIAVAHIGVIMTQLQKVTDGDAYKAMGFEIENLSVTDLCFDQGSWHLGRANHNP